MSIQKKPNRITNPVLRRIHVFDPNAVTQIRSEAEVPAEEVGLDPKVIGAVWKSVVDCYREGLQPAIALCIRKGGKVVLDRSIGHTHGNGPKGIDRGDLRLANPDSLFSLFSASKPVAAMVMHHLVEHGKIRVDDKIAHFLPEFGAHGKHEITLRHVLSHTSGVPAIPGHLMDMDLLKDEERIRQEMFALPTKYKPGRVLAYHALSGGFVLNELVKEIEGVDIRQYLATHILDPLGFQEMNFGTSVDNVKQVARHYYTGEKAFPPFSKAIERSIGVPYEDAVELSNDPRFHSSVIPSANVVTTANEASRFYQMLLNGGSIDGVRVFDSKTVHRATAEQMYGRPDMMLGMPVRYSQGFWLGTKYMNLFGSDTEQAFGHLGLSNVVVWADRERDISVALLTNGKPFITLGSLKWVMIPRTISALFPKVAPSEQSEARVLGGKE